MAELKNWNEVTMGLYRYVIAPKVCYEIHKFRACSKCGSYVEFTETLGASFWKFCPYCGAHMDLKE